MPLLEQDGEDEKMFGILDEVRIELERAQSRFGPMHSAHEGIAVVEEEFLELREAIYRMKWDASEKNCGPYARDLAHIRVEAIQLAAMAVRFVYDVVP